jgi:putative ABC transport system permease protein
VVFQFLISFVFIITTIVLYKQVRFEKNIDTGFNAENILNVELQNSNFETLKQEISTHQAVSRVSASTFILCTGTRWGTRAKRPDASEFLEVDFISIDNDFIENFELELVAGENFPETTHPENERFVILNEMAIERFGFESPLDAIGQILTFRENKHLEVIGVVKDFLSQSTSSPVYPLVLRVIPEYFEYANLKIRTDDLESTLFFLETKWKELEPFRPFRYSFFEDQLEDYFAEVENVVRGVSFITFLAILIAFFGLLGMVIYDTEARVKEIGIRKVMGASVMDIILVTSKSFVFLLLLSAALAAPVAWLINNMLLQDLSTRIDLGFGIFAFGLLMMFALGFITIFSQTIKAALGNPVDSLRYE